MRPGKNGGRLRTGNPGHIGAGGRPPDAIRAQLLDLGYTKAIPFLTDLLDGTVSVSLLGKCDACEHEQQLSEEWVELLMNRIKTSVDQRLKASEQTMKYGLQAKELVITSSNAAEFFGCIDTACVELFGAEARDRLEARAIALHGAKR
jgi:hypothetical protein